MRTDVIQQTLQALNGATADIEASALISIDGLLMASAMPRGTNEDRVGAMSAAVLALGQRVVRELAKGQLQRVLIQGEQGCIIVSAAGTDAVLTVLTRPDAKLGLILLDMRRAAETLARLR